MKRFILIVLSVLLLSLPCEARRRWIPKTASATSTTFVTGQSLSGTLRSNFSGGLGFRYSNGASPITVTELGRWVVSGNSQTHVLRIRNGSGTDLGNVTVNTSGATVGAFLYGTLSSPVVLSASTDYYFFSDETTPGGDQWYDGDTSLTYTAVGTIPSNAYYDGNVNSGGAADTSYVPVSFKYQ